MKLKYLTILLVLYIITISVSTEKPQDQLKYIGSLFRHGARGPIKHYADYSNFLY